MNLRKPIETVTSHIITPHWFHPKKPGFPYGPAYEALDTLLEHIHGLKIPTDILQDRPFAGSIILTIEDLSQQDIALITARNPLSEYWKDSFVIRGCGTWLEPSKIAEFARDTGRISNREVVARICTNLSAEIINKLLVLLNIYLPGSSRCLHYYRKDKMFGQMSQACDSSFDNATIIMMEAGLSPTPQISLIDFITWSQKIHGFWHGRPTTNIGRALNFFSHAHHQIRLTYTFADISWIIAALEAIFTETNQEIRSKIIRRTISLCPEIEKFTSKKEIGRLYDFRSRFLHGDIAIPNQFSGDEGGTWYGHEFSKVFDISATILIRSIQKVAETGRTEIRFEEVIAE